MIIPNTRAAATVALNNRKKVILKNCAPFTKRISNINNNQVDNTEDVDVFLPMYNLIEYRDIY